MLAPQYLVFTFFSALRLFPLAASLSSAYYCEASFTAPLAYDRCAGTLLNNKECGKNETKVLKSGDVIELGSQACKLTYGL